MRRGRRIGGCFPLSVFLVLCLTVSCTDDSTETTDLATEDSVEVRFTVSLGNGVATKSTYSEYTGTTQDGTDYENTVNSIQVFLYATVNGVSDVCIAALTNFTLLESSSGTYVYYGYVPTSGLTTDGSGSYSFSGKIMVLANCPTYYPTVGTTALSDVSSLAYSFSSPSSGGTRSDGIPMWGIQSVENVTLSSGICTVISDEIDLLRAMAKIVIVLDDDDYEEDDEHYEATASAYTITSATVSTYNTSGLCAPDGCSSVTSTTGLDTECKSIPSSVSTAGSLSLVVEDSAYVYVPEFAASTDATVSVTIQKTSTGKSNTETVYLQEYSDGTKSGTGIDLVRNHIYTYTLSKAYSSDLYVSCTVDDWTDETSTVAWDESDLTVTLLPNGADDFSDTDSGDEEARYCVLTYPRWNIKSSSNDVYSTAGARFEGSRSYASFEFKLTSTSGQVVWKAYLSNSQYFYFNTGTSDINSKTSYNASTGVSRSDSYCIKIGPSGPDNALWDDTYTYDDITSYGVSASGGSESPTRPGVKYIDSCPPGYSQFLVYADDEYRSSGDSEYYVYYDGSTYNTYYSNSYGGYSRYSYPVGSEVRDTVVAIYTDLFILIDGAAEPTPLTINPLISDLSVTYDGHFKERVYPGGTYEETVQVEIDGESTSVTLGEGQWIRFFWTCAMPGVDDDGGQIYTSKDVWEKLMTVNEDTGDYVYLPESDHWFNE